MKRDKGLFTRTVIGRLRRLSVLQRNSAEPSCQRLINALYTSMRELGAYNFEPSLEGTKRMERFHEFLCKSKWIQNLMIANQV